MVVVWHSRGCVRGSIRMWRGRVETGKGGRRKRRATAKSRDGEGGLGEDANLQRSREDGIVERRQHEAGKQEGGRKRGGERDHKAEGRGLRSGSGRISDKHNSARSTPDSRRKQFPHVDNLQGIMESVETRGGDSSKYCRERASRAGCRE